MALQDCGIHAPWPKSCYRLPSSGAHDWDCCTGSASALPGRRQPHPTPPHITAWPCTGFPQPRQAPLRLQLARDSPCRQAPHRAGALKPKPVPFLGWHAPSLSLATLRASSFFSASRQWLPRSFHACCSGTRLQRGWRRKATRSAEAQQQPGSEGPASGPSPCARQGRHAGPGSTEPPGQGPQTG